MNNILITGGSGLLGTELQKYIDCVAPSQEDMDITVLPELKYYNPKLVIHCAAYTDVAKAEKERAECFDVNVEGTLNICRAFPNASIVYISTEYAMNPVNFYSYTKLWGEEMVKKHARHYLIIRTLFKPKPFPYNKAFVDQYTAGDYIDIIAPMIAVEIMKMSDYASTSIHLGTGRKTMFELARKTRPDIQGISVDDIKDVTLPKDYQI